ncbi:MAG: prepilin peptidase [bacterium]
MAFSSALIVITFIDLDYQIIPDSITLPGILIGLLFASISSVWNITISANEPFVLQSITLVDPYDRSQQMGFVNSLLGIATGGGIFLAIAVISRGGMGGGDIKMMGMMGSVLGWKGVLMTTFAASLTGSVIGVLLMIFGGKGRKSKIPFGPFLALGGMISLLFGQELLWIYLRGTN